MLKYVTSKQALNVFQTSPTFNDVADADASIGVATAERRQKSPDPSCGAELALQKRDDCFLI